MHDTFSLRNMTKGIPPRIPFSRIKDAILEKKYELSLVLVGDKRIQTLNREHRGKDRVTDILSFPLDDCSGEIFLNVKRARMNAKKHDMSEHDFLYRLFIHGCLHLKGMDHGSRMDSTEKKFLKTFLS